VKCDKGFEKADLQGRGNLSLPGEAFMFAPSLAAPPVGPSLITIILYVTS
jgi:hypothetical protein